MRWAQHGIVGLVGLLVLLVASATHAQDSADDLMKGTELTRPVTLDKYAYLKRMSLDLLGRVPSYEEYAALESEDDVPASWIEDALNSEEFLDVTAAYHRDLLWTNVGQTDFVNFQFNMQRANVNGTVVWYRRFKSHVYRGNGADAYGDNIPCGDWEETSFYSDGTIDPVTQGDGRRLEGWVWVEPYWALGTAMSEPLRVCARDAQTAETSAATGRSCNERDSLDDEDCGCGDNLRFCVANGEFPAELDIGEAFNQQVLQVIRWVIGNDRPYHEILTTRRSFVNGPIVHYYENLAPLASQVEMLPGPVGSLYLPRQQYTDYRWTEVLLGEEHSGILTAPGFLLRFQTNRARANRFYNAFLDRFFDASNGSDSTDCRDDGADLTKRCKCQRCHRTVEPLAAHWGRFKEQGAGFLPRDEFPLYDELCARCATDPAVGCPLYCRNNYVIETVPADREPYVGYLRSYEFLDPRDEVNVDGGPRLWVERSLHDGSLANGVVTRLWSHLARRDLVDSKADRQIREELIATFVNTNYDLKALVSAIVTHPTYRRIR